MLTNEMIKRIHDNAVAHGFHDPDSEPTFGEYCALIHEEISEAFSAWRNGEPDEYVVDGKPEGVWVELADVVIRIADWIGHTEVIIEPNEDYKKLHDELIDLSLTKASFGDFIAYTHWLLSRAYAVADIVDTYTTMINLVYHMYVRAELEGIDLDAIIERKCAYNATRPYKHGKRM